MAWGARKFDFHTGRPSPPSRWRNPRYRERAAHAAAPTTRPAGRAAAPVGAPQPQTGRVIYAQEEAARGASEGRGVSASAKT